MLLIMYFMQYQSFTFQSWSVDWIGLKADHADALPPHSRHPKGLSEEMVDRGVRVQMGLVQLPDLDPDVGADVQVHVVAVIFMA